MDTNKTAWRSSHCQWVDSVPKTIARKQQAWEKGNALLRARELGFSNEEIADMFGIVNTISIGSMIHQATRLREIDPRSPVEAWLEDPSWKKSWLKRDERKNKTIKDQEERKATAKARQERLEARELAELARLKAKYNN